ncbi:MAG: crossover junction endodeoxyribonuclease RuvC [Balneolaceae bacterium]
MSKRPVILGIDPGSRQTGYALLAEESHGWVALEVGVIRLANIDNQSERLDRIFMEVAGLIKRFNPTDAAIETPVYSVDPLAMLKLGRAQAAAMLAIRKSGLPVTEYYPKAIKKAVTGNGNASKKQVAGMLCRLVSVENESMASDASDALAIAWCHQLEQKRPAGLTRTRTYHQNNKKSGWAAFVDENPDRVR